MRTLEMIVRGELAPLQQNHDDATLAPILKREDGEIDPEIAAVEIERRVRGFDPWPGVWLSRAGRRVRLIEVRVLEEPPATETPGRILELRSDGLVMACGGGSRLLLESVQPEGKRVLSARDAVNGRQIAVGDRLERIPRAD
jgi:methionyl-tRNA formyltransferase